MKRQTVKSLCRLATALGCALLLLSSAAQAIEVGVPAPAFQLPLPGGATAGVQDFKGKVVYLDFWASWCGPCRQTFPWMNDMQKRYAGQGLQILAVNVDKRQADAESFLLKTPAAFTVAFDAQGRTPSLYQIVGMPTSFLIGRDGRVIQQHTSFHEADRDELEKQIRNALGLAGNAP